MRLHILGLGPVGNLVAFHLRRVLPSHHSITLIHKDQKQANTSLSHGGIIRIENEGIVATAHDFGSEVFEATKPAIPSAASGVIRGGADIIDSLFITTKAHTTLRAVRRLLPRLSPNATIVLMHNGMGVYEELIHEIFRNPEQRPHFILSSNTHGVFRKDVKHYVHTGVGSIKIAIVPDPGGRDFEAGFNDTTVLHSERRPRLSDITSLESDPMYKRYASLRDTVAALLLAQPLDVSWLPLSDFQTVMRRKLVANAVINPLTALMGCRNGDIFTTNSAVRIMQRVCSEASQAFEAEFSADSKAWSGGLISQGIKTEDIPIGQFPRELINVALEEEVRRVAEATKGNISSMLADVRRGRRTEVEYINGYLLRLGATYRIPMPTTAVLLNLVKMRSAIPVDQML
ncbi:putative 2-dehydropantoate 2-reductase [Termitomyces sp. J132]|nr:hypothetical protein C0989_005703 [Termitomyces sp. Mn162]KAH0591051.1 hypothetical protein H2248_001160 [Termitomyces sp. 'cryptogamus']KNZ80691.1 putative 2-dehydropantoate 2-reductase [Termitomyces sp. J132]